MRGRMRALEDWGRRFGPIDEGHGGTTLATPAQLLPKYILRNTWLNTGFLKTFPRAFHVLVFIMIRCKQALRCSITQIFLILEIFSSGSISWYESSIKNLSWESEVLLTLVWRCKADGQKNK